MSESNTILVTGGVGYIGSHTVVALQEEGFDVVIADNLSNSHEFILDRIKEISGIAPRFYKVDLCNESALRDLFKTEPKICASIHFAALKAVGESVENPLLYYRNNLVSLMNLMKVQLDNQVKCLVFSSSCTVYGEPDVLPVTEQSPIKPALSPYGNTKQIGEEFLSDQVNVSDLNAIALRYFNPVGAHASALIGELPNGKPNNLVPFITQTGIGKHPHLNVFGNDYNTPDGTCIRDFIHVEDVASAHVVALKRLIDKKATEKFEVFNIGTGKGYSVLEAIKAFETASGKKLAYQIQPRRPGDIEKVYADTTKSNEILGWKAKKGIQEMMSSAWAWETQLSQNAISMERKKILITGGAGFIGSHVVRRIVTNYPNYDVINLDKLTYAGNLMNLRDIEHLPNYSFVKGDIVDEAFIAELFAIHKFDGVIHLAAESHVDRSITNPNEFIKTNVLGTANLLNAAKETWKGAMDGKRFYHISTDEVYGSLGAEGYFTEETRYDPRSPYSASKASSDHLVRAYHHTYNMPVVISNCSNNYGSFHFPEKLIPLAINNIKHMRPIPVYGKGDNVRDWLFVEDHARAIDLIFHKGRSGETYNIGGANEWQNIDLIRKLCEIMDEKLQRSPGTSASLINFVKDRAGHDQRYAIDFSKLKKELGWEPSLNFEEGLRKTVEWYLNNEEWLNGVTSGDYQHYYQEQYTKR
jgi:dTDP-glucose 4,6-dehydratase